MAAPTHDHDASTEVDYTIGSMEIDEQRSTFDFFVGLTKWGSLALAVALVFLVLATSTGAGFLGSSGAAVVLLAAGIFFLRGKNDGETH